MPPPEEAVLTTISELKEQLDYYNEHQRKQLLIGNLLDASIKFTVQLCVINLILHGGYKTYAQISRELAERDTDVTSDMIGRYAKAYKVPEMEILWAIFKLSEEKTKTVWKARQERTPSKAYRERIQ